MMPTRSPETPRRSTVTRSAAALVSAALLVLLAGCALSPTPNPGPGPGPDPSPAAGPMAVDVIIAEDPVGGRGVTDIACTLDVAQMGVDGTDPVLLHIEWSAPCGTHKTETVAFRGGHEMVTTTYGDPAGQPLGMTFWVTVRWTDSRGAHTVRSQSAVCTY